MKTIKPTGKRTLVSLDEAIKRVEGYKPLQEQPETPAPEKEYFDGDFITLYDVNPWKMEPSTWERYSAVHVAEKPLNRLNAYQIIPLKEVPGKLDGGLMLPSFPLMCTILAELYSGRDEKKKRTLLGQYDAFSFKYQFIHDTIVDFKEGVVIHYPTRGSIAERRNYRSIVAKKKGYQFRFEKELLPQSISDLAGLGYGDQDFVDILTGDNGHVLDDIARYFEKELKIILPENIERCEDTCAVLWQCLEDEILIRLDLDVNKTAGLVRPVRTII